MASLLNSCILTTFPSEGKQLLQCGKPDEAIHEFVPKCLLRTFLCRPRRISNAEWKLVQATIVLTCAQTFFFRRPAPVKQGGAEFAPVAGILCPEAISLLSDDFESVLLWQVLEVMPSKHMVWREQPPNEAKKSTVHPIFPQPLLL